MSKVRDVLTSAPDWVGLYDAARWARIAEIAFDEEVADKESAGKRMADETVSDRLRTVLAWRNYIPSLEGQQIGGYVCDLLVFAAMSVDRNSGMVTGDNDAWEKYRSKLKGEEPKYPQVSAILSVDEASILDYWN